MKNDENFIVFADLKKLFLKLKWVVLAGALLFGVLGFFVRSQFPVKYEIVALFKDGGKSGTIPFNGIFETMLQTIGIGKDSTQGHVLITSPLILEPVIEHLGLQASVVTESNWKQGLQFLRKSWHAEKKQVVIEQPTFEFENVYYKGNIEKKYEIFFTATETFEVRNSKKNTLKIGHLGESVSVEDVTFTLTKTPADLRLRTSYPLIFSAMEETLISLRRFFVEKPDALFQEEGIIELTLNYPNYYLGKRILNTIMEVYQSYIQDENRQVTQNQLAYLEKRRDEFCAKMRESFQVHTAYLKENLSKNGALTLKEQLPDLLEKKKRLLDERLALEINLSKVENLSNLGTEGKKLQSQLLQIAKERDELSLALLSKHLSEPEKVAYLKRLGTIESEKLKVETGVDTFFTRLGLPFRRNGPYISLATDDAQQLKKLQHEKQSLLSLLRERNHSQLEKSFLADRIRLISLHEDVLMKRLFHGGRRNDEYRGVDLTSARKLLLDYLHKRDEILSRVRQLRFAVNQLNQTGSESMSLASSFPDPLSQNLVHQIGETEKKLRQERTWTEKERERLEKTLKALKEDLARHAEQSISLASLEKEHLEDRIESLQLALLDLVGQEIALTEKQLEECSQEERKQLLRQKELINEQLIALQEEMTFVPDAWLREQELKFSADMNQGMLEALVHLVESKNIESNLMTIESKPLGVAHSSLFPKAPRLKLFACVGALVGALLTFVCSLFYYFYKGIPLSLRNLEVRGKKVLGSLTDVPKNLEVLRHFSLLASEEKLITLVLGEGKDYSEALGTLFQKEGKKVLLIDLNFNKESKEKNFWGLAQFLQGEVREPTILKKTYGDYICVGEITSFGDELIKHKKFKELLDKMKGEYDVILLVLTSEARDSLPKYFLSISDVVAISLRNESYGVLLPYFRWEDSGKTLVFLD